MGKRKEISWLCEKEDSRLDLMQLHLAWIWKITLVLIPRGETQWTFHRDCTGGLGDGWEDKSVCCASQHSGGQKLEDPGACWMSACTKFSEKPHFKDMGWRIMEWGIWHSAVMHITHTWSMWDTWHSPHGHITHTCAYTWSTWNTQKWKSGWNSVGCFLQCLVITFYPLSIFKLKLKTHV